MRLRDRAVSVLGCIGIVIFCGAVVVSAVRMFRAGLPAPFCSHAISLFSNINTDYFSAEFDEVIVSKSKVPSGGKRSIYLIWS
jgi:hypothetical protein